jgi:ABC-type glycerol-3-phosphate transport system substrate-binding protein
MLKIAKNVKNARKKIVGVLLAVTMVVPLTFTGCGAGAPAGAPAAGEAPAAGGERIVIEYWNVNTEVFGGPAVDRLIAEFNEKQDRIEVVSRFNADMYAGLMSNLMAEVAAGRFPAVVQVGWAFIDFFVANFPFTGPQEAIDRYHPEDAGFLEEFFLPSMLELAQSRDGQQVGLPYAVSTPVLFLNVDLLREAGLDEGGPKTWAEVDYFSRRIRDVTGHHGIYIQEPADSWGTQAILESNGARFLTYRDGRIEASFACENGIEAYTLYYELVRDGAALHISWDEGVNAFAAGHVGMLFTTIARRHQVQTAAAFEITAFPTPTWGDKPRRVPAGGAMLAILSQTPEERAAAWEFMRFMYADESVAEWTLGTGFIPPTRRAVANSPRLAEFLEENEMMIAAIDQMPDIVSWAAFPGDAGLQA